MRKARVYEETLGEDKGKERCLGSSRRDCSCVMLGFSLLMNRVCLIHVNTREEPEVEHDDGCSGSC
jgi:hypothetical protein